MYLRARSSIIVATNATATIAVGSRRDANPRITKYMADPKNPADAPGISITQMRVSRPTKPRNPPTMRSTPHVMISQGEPVEGRLHRGRGVQESADTAEEHCCVGEQVHDADQRFFDFASVVDCWVCGDHESPSQGSGGYLNRARTLLSSATWASFSSHASCPTRTAHRFAWLVSAVVW
jgi:hypothetical protein